MCVMGCEQCDPLDGSLHLALAPGEVNHPPGEDHQPPEQRARLHLEETTGDLVLDGEEVDMDELAFEMEDTNTDENAIGDTTFEALDEDVPGWDDASPAGGPVQPSDLEGLPIHPALLAEAPSDPYRSSSPTIFGDWLSPSPAQMRGQWIEPYQPGVEPYQPQQALPTLPPYQHPGPELEEDEEEAYQEPYTMPWEHSKVETPQQPLPTFKPTQKRDSQIYRNTVAVKNQQTKQEPLQNPSPQPYQQPLPEPLPFPSQSVLPPPYQPQTWLNTAPATLPYHSPQPPSYQNQQIQYSQQPQPYQQLQNLQQFQPHTPNQQHPVLYQQPIQPYQSTPQPSSQHQNKTYPSLKPQFYQKTVQAKKELFKPLPAASIGPGQADSMMDSDSDSESGSDLEPPTHYSPNTSSASTEPYHSPNTSRARLESSQSPNTSSASTEFYQSPNVSRALPKSYQSPIIVSASKESYQSPNTSSSKKEPYQSPNTSRANVEAYQSPHTGRASTEPHTSQHPDNSFSTQRGTEPYRSPSTNQAPHPLHHQAYNRVKNELQMTPVLELSPLAALNYSNPFYSRSSSRGTASPSPSPALWGRGLSPSPGQLDRSQPSEARVTSGKSPSQPGKRSSTEPAPAAKRAAVATPPPQAGG